MKEIEGVKRSSNEEMLKNERLTVILNRIKMEEANLERLTSVEEEKKGTLEIQLTTVQHLQEQTDKDMENATLVSKA